MTSPLRIGVLARAEDRGLGIQTWEAFRHLPDAKALVVDVGPLSDFPPHFDRFEHQPVVKFIDGVFIDREFISWWLGSIDVLYAAETFYDKWIIHECRRKGVATVLHTNPELHHVDEAELVTVTWLPTPWRRDEVEVASGPTQLVPYPVALDRFAYLDTPTMRDLRRIGAPKVLHVAGHAAYQDRNGTRLLAAATPMISPPISVWVSSQDEHVALGAGATRVPAALDYWRLYELADILVMPRRFGGLCLPIQEAMAAGMAVVALDTEPHDWYGCADIEALVSSEFMTGSGVVDVHTTSPRAIADAVLACAAPSELARRQARSRRWAEAHSWDALLPVWLTQLDHAHFAERAR